MKTVYCVMGRTSSGKSTLVKKVCEKLNMKCLKSYTTRDRRKGETEETSDHIFISKNEIEQYKDDMIAYVERVGYCSFATKQQLLDCDFYIINPKSYLEMLDKIDNSEIRIKTIIITTPYEKLENHAKKRGDYQSWKDNYMNENEEFKLINRLGLDDYRVLNDGSIEDSVNKMIKIIKKDLEKQMTMKPKKEE